MLKGHVDVATRGAFLSLTINAAKALIEKMVANQSWGEERKQQKKHAFREGGRHACHKNRLAAIKTE
jgi:hypothetical protein